MEMTYVYWLWGKDQQLLYAGITDNVERRLREHKREKFWWREVARHTHIAFETREEAEWAEWAVIATCKPVYNRALSPPSLRAVRTVVVEQRTVEVRIPAEPPAVVSVEGDRVTARQAIVEALRGAGSPLPLTDVRNLIAAAGVHVSKQRVDQLLGALTRTGDLVCHPGAGGDRPRYAVPSVGDR